MSGLFFFASPGTFVPLAAGNRRVRKQVMAGCGGHPDLKTLEEAVAVGPNAGWKEGEAIER